MNFLNDFKRGVLTNCYSIGIFLFALFTLPKLLMRRKKVLERLIPPSLEEKIRGEECIWIHAVSVGEVKAVSHLARELSRPLIVSTITETGLEEAKRAIPQALCHILLPIDLKCVMRSLLKGLKIKIVILSETDYWFHFLKEVKAIGAQIILVNGKLSQRSVKMRGAFKGVTRELFSLVDHFFLQTEKEREKFLSLGVLREKTEVTGNLKFEVKGVSSRCLEEFRGVLGLKKSESVVVFGSTHEEEESFLFGVIERLLKEKALSLLVVPRHPERFTPFYERLRVLGASLLSRGGGGSLIVVDQMGILTRCYELADIAVVCGSFVKGIGGHNILEPLFFKVPTFFGPFMEGQKGIVEEVLSGSGGLQVRGEALVETVLRGLEDKESLKAVGCRGFQVVQGKKGGISSILQFLVALK